MKLITTRLQLRELAQGEILHANVQAIPQYFRILGMAARADWERAAEYGIKPEWLPDPDDARQLFDKHSRRPAQTEEELGQFQAEMDAFIEKYEKAFVQYRRAILEISHERIDLLTSQDISDAEDSGLVNVAGWSDPNNNRIHTVGFYGAQAYLEEVWAGAAAQIESNTGAVMFEPGSSQALQIITGNGASPGHAGSDGNANQIAVSAASLLPGLKSATIAEVLTVRDALSAYLPNFRAAAIDLSQKVRDSDPNDPRDAAQKIDEEWHKEINPAMSEIRFALERGSFQRHILEEFANKDSMVAATGSAGMLIGGGTVIGGVAALVPGALAGTYPFIKAVVATLKDRDKAKENRFYFLYGAREQLAKYAPD